MKYIGIGFIVILFVYGYLYYRAHHPSKTILKTILIPNTHNTYFRVYQDDPFFDDSWNLYYEVIEDDKVVCPLNYLTHVSAALMPFEFDVNRIDDIAYIAECSEPLHINAIYNHKTQTCACISIGEIDSLYQTRPFIDMTNILRFCK